MAWGSVTSSLKGAAQRLVDGLTVGLACLFSWYDLAFRVSVGPLFSLPVWFVGYPRRDLARLCFLAVIVLVWVVAWLVLRRRGLPRASGLAGLRVLGAATIAMLVGTALFVLGTPGVPTCMAGGALAGLGFAVTVAVLVLRSVSYTDGPSNLVKTAACALALACVVKLLALPLAAFPTQLLVCALPLASLAGFAWDGLVVARRGGTATPAPVRNAAPDLARSLYRDHATTLCVCFFGKALFLGIAGFVTDGMAGDAYLTFHLATSVAGGALACAVLLVSRRLNPEAAFILLPVALGTAAMLLPFGGAFWVDTLSLILGKAVDGCCFMLAAVVLVELARVDADHPGAAVGLLAGIAALMVLGILAGGALMSLFGLDATVLALAALLLVYLAMLALGVSAQRRTQARYIIVRNPDDVARIAKAQAQAIARDFPTLSPRELDVLELLLQHQTIDGIAAQLGISRNTVKSHIGHLYEKTGLNSRQRLVDLAATKTIRAR